MDLQLRGKKCWICKFCAIKQPPQQNKHFVDAGLSNAIRHLYTSHHLKAPVGQRQSREEIREEKMSRRRRTLHTFLNLGDEKADDVKMMHRIHTSFDRKHFQRLLIEWIVDESLPFRITDSSRFHALCSYLNPEVEAQQAMIIRTTIRARIVSEFNRHQEHVIAVLQRAPGQIHFAFDGWRSKNRKNVYGLACFFRDEQTNQPCKIILGMPEVAGCHAGDTIDSSIVKLINAYNIGNKAGYFTLDNARNMDTAMEFIGNVFGFDGRRCRGRCFGHILNLAAKALLNPLPNEGDAIDQYLDDNEQLTSAQYELWRRQGPVGKLRILVIAVDQSDRLNDMFLTCQKTEYAASTNPGDQKRKPLQLVKDNQTRWLGTYYMIKRALRLRPYMELTRIKFQQAWEQDNRSTGRDGIRPSAKQPPFLQENNWLTEADWQALARIALILKDFEDCLTLSRV